MCCSQTKICWTTIGHMSHCAALWKLKFSHWVKEAANNANSWSGIDYLWVCWKPKSHPGRQLNVNHTVFWQRWCENGTFVLVDPANFCARCNLVLHPPIFTLRRLSMTRPTIYLHGYLYNLQHGFGNKPNMRSNIVQIRDWFLCNATMVYLTLK